MAAGRSLTGFCRTQEREPGMMTLIGRDFGRLFYSAAVTFGLQGGVRLLVVTPSTSCCSPLARDAFGHQHRAPWGSFVRLPPDTAPERV
jgi:hypothetical protein